MRKVVVGVVVLFVSMLFVGCGGGPKYHFDRDTCETVHTVYTMCYLFSRNKQDSCDKILADVEKELSSGELKRPEIANNPKIKEFLNAMKDACELGCKAGKGKAIILTDDQFFTEFCAPE